uniref:G-protein coupled receptors family 1 profile domain-containing protein n=1 Tax=Panagrellus redivivus TaxID=6233 RepID=A0A7E4VD17_PANRE
MCLLYPYVMYLIWRKSPSAMFKYRIFLMVITTSDFIFCVMYNLFLQPMPLFPNYGSVVYGLAKGVDDIYLLIIVIVAVQMVIVTMFTQGYSLLYRYAAFSASTQFASFFQNQYMHYAFVGYGIVASGGLLIGLGTSQMNGQAFKLQDIYTSSYYNFEDTVIAFQLDPVKSTTWLIFSMINLGIIASLSYGTIGLIFHVLNQRADLLSSNTRKVQKIFARATLLQLILPFVLLYLPTLNAVLIMMNIEPTALRKHFIFVGSCLLSMYPLGNTFVTILFIQSYRRHLIAILARIFRCIHYSDAVTIIPSVVTARRKTLQISTLTPFDNTRLTSQT